MSSLNPQIQGGTPAPAARPLVSSSQTFAVPSAAPSAAPAAAPATGWFHKTLSVPVWSILFALLLVIGIGGIGGWFVRVAVESEPVPEREKLYSGYEYEVPAQLPESFRAVWGPTFTVTDHGSLCRDTLDVTQLVKESAGGTIMVNREVLGDICTTKNVTLYLYYDGPVLPITRVVDTSAQSGV